MDTSKNMTPPLGRHKMVNACMSRCCLSNAPRWRKSHLLSTSVVKAGHTRHPNLCCKFLKIAHLTNKKRPKNSTSPGTDAAFLCECPANWIAIFGTTLGRYYQAKQFSNLHHQLVTMRFKDFFSNVLKLN